MASLKGIIALADILVLEIKHSLKIRKGKVFILQIAKVGTH